MTDTYARHSELVAAMSRVAGVDLGRRVVQGTLTPADLGEVIATCTRCGSVAACEDDLCGGCAAVPDYCLNRPLYSLLTDP